MINENGLLNIFPTAEASGSIVSFENGADGIPMESLSVAIEPIQDLHGYANPWPGGGGKNKFDASAATFKKWQLVSNAFEPRTDDYEYVSFSVSGENITLTTQRTYMGICFAVDAVDYNRTASLHGTISGGKAIALYNGYTSGATRISNGATSCSIPANTSGYVAIRIDSAQTCIINCQIEQGSTASSWAPFSNICPISGRTGLSVYVSPTQDQQDATTYAVDWTTQAGTVYHGTVDPVTGQLTVDSVKYATTWGNYSGSTTLNACVRRTFTAPDKSKYPNYAWTPVSNILQYSADYSGDYPHFYVNSSTSNNVIVTLPAGTSDDTSIEVVYELATPLTYQLTPQEVATLLGANRVWSNAGDISLVYHAQVDATPSSIDGLFINGEGLQADGWFLKWRKLAAPKPKTDFVSVWGRDGDIDLTESETDGQVFYENRELTMDMVYMGEDWTDAYSELLDMLHGKECAVQFSNDPYWYWAGRIIASLYEHKPHSLTMSGIMFPYKLSVAKVTRSATVSGAIESNGVDVVLPSSRMRVSPKVTVVAGTGESVTLKWGTKTKTLSAGTYYVRGLKVGSDDVTINVWGTGTVTFEYRKGML